METVVILDKSKQDQDKCFGDIVYKTKADAENALEEYDKSGERLAKDSILVEGGSGWMIWKTGTAENFIYGCSNWNKVYGK